MGFRTLASKLAAIAVVQLVLLASVFMGVGWLANGRPPELGGRGPRGPGPAITVYDRAGQAVASTVDPPLRAEDEGVRVAPALVGGGAGAIVTFPPGPPRPSRYVTPLTTLFLGGLLILGVGSFLTARGIVRPLRDLSRVAKALGGGDLRARSGLARADELGDVARAFDEMGERIERLLLAEKELLANVSHELRTPLARIRVALDIAGEGDAEAGRLSMTEIGVDLSELELLIDDILTTTRLEIARGTSEPAQFELRVVELEPEALCVRAAERFRARHPLRPLEVVIQDELPRIEADPVLLRRVIDNLLANAHKYSPEATSAISLQATRSGEAVTFAIEDHGMGVSAEDLPRLFTPFFRTDRSRTRGTGGVGLGLTLAKRIVEAHGGTIDATSTLGRGSTFRATIPARGAGRSASSTARPPTPE